MTEQEQAQSRYVKRERQRFIDMCLRSFGRVNREPLCLWFGISEQQASRDLQDYLAAHPGNMSFDKSQRTYLRMPGFIEAY